MSIFSIFENEMMKREREIATELNVPIVNVCTVGSTLICGVGNDIDLLCLVPSDDCLFKAGFSKEIETEYESELHSWRRDGLNIIAVQDRGFFLAEVAIAHGAKACRDLSPDMDSRGGRIDFHSAVRDAVISRMGADT